MKLLWQTTQKIKRFIHRIKRHKRNKSLSNFAKGLYFFSKSQCGFKFGLHPLIYEIIHIKYCENDFYMLKLFPDYTLEDKYSEFLIFCKE